MFPLHFPLLLKVRNDSGAVVSPEEVWEVFLGAKVITSFVFGGIQHMENVGNPVYMDVDIEVFPKWQKRNAEFPDDNSMTSCLEA